MSEHDALRAQHVAQRAQHVALRPRVDSMKPASPPPTRTADPRPPDHFWTRGNYLAYVAFGSTGVLMLLVGLGILNALYALGQGEAAWNALMDAYRNPLYVAFHALALVGLTWFAMRFFHVFPKTQPPTIGPKSGVLNQARTSTAVALPASMSASTISSAAYFASTSAPSPSGSVSSSSSVPAWRSSAKVRIESSGIISISSRLMLWNAVTMSMAETKSALKLKKKPLAAQNIAVTTYAIEVVK